jgi:hypothetical protein
MKHAASFVGARPRTDARSLSLQEELNPMRKWLLAIVAGVTLAANSGCLIPIYSADPARRARQLIYTSEDLRQFLDEWERIWFLDQPSHMQPLSTHGGII